MLNLHPKNESRFSRKLESLFWWILRLFPLILLFCVYFTVFRSGDLIEYMNVSDDPNLIDYFFDFSGFMGRFTSVFWDSFLIDSLNSLLGDNGILPLFNSNSAIFFYFSYLVGLEISRLFLDVILFIPKLARKWINMACQED